jgi:hypothetical protein
MDRPGLSVDMESKKRNVGLRRLRNTLDNRFYGELAKKVWPFTDQGILLGGTGFGLGLAPGLTKKIGLVCATKQ